jgi:alpha-mannosidase
VEIPAGGEMPAAVRDLDSEALIPVARTDRKITFPVNDVPAGGYRTYTLVPGPEPAATAVSGDILETSYFKLSSIPLRGGIASLVVKTDGRELVRSGSLALGQFLHEQFSKKDVDAFMKAYNHVYYDWYGFPYYDFNKPKLDSTLVYSQKTPSGWSLSVTSDATGHRAVLTTRNTLGLAEEYSLKFFFPANSPCVDITWSVTGKTPELIPEGGWICLPLAVENPNFRVSHVSAPFTPEKDLVPGTNNICSPSITGSPSETE